MSYLHGLKGPLKKAAIDAYMKQEGWLVPDVPGYNHYEDGYPDGQDTVTMPDENGNGGGNWQSNKIRELIWNWREDPKYRNAFEQIRQRVDDALEPWEDLPDPKGFDKSLEHLRQANRRLSTSASTSGGTATGGGGIGASLTLIQENSTAMSGAMITQFKVKFLLQLGNAIGGHHGLTVILGQAVAGEQNLLEQARADVVTAVKTATAALHAYARSNDPGELSFVLKVAGAVVDGVAAFATGGATAAIQGAAKTLTLLSTVAEHEEKKSKEPEAKNYDGLMKAFETALKDINAQIKHEEGLIRDNMKTNLEQLRADEGSYNLSNPIQHIDDDSDLHEGPGRAIIHDRSLVEEITGTAMPEIAGELDKAQKEVFAGWSGTPYYRDSSIGIGEQGPYPQWADLASPLYLLINDLSWEVENGAKTLKLAIEDMGRTDTDAQDALEKHAASISDHQEYHVT